MKKSILLFIFGFLFISNCYADDIIDKVYRINSYSYNEEDDSFELQKYGTAIFLGEKKVITNANIVLDDDLNPYQNYELCETNNLERTPVCFTIGELSFYDIEKDLALLKLNKKGETNTDLKISKKQVNIGDKINIFTYPTKEYIYYIKGLIIKKEDKDFLFELEKDIKKPSGGVFNNNGYFIGLSNITIVGGKSFGKLIGLSTIKDFLKGKGNIIKNKKGVDKRFYLFLLKRNKSFKENKLYNNLFSLNDLNNYNFYIKDINRSFKQGLVSYNLSSDTGKTNIYIRNYNKLGDNLSKKEKISFLNNSYDGVKVLNLDDKEVFFYYFYNKKTKKIDLFFNYLDIDYIIKGYLKNKKELINAIKLYLNEMFYFSREEKVLNKINYRNININNGDNFFVKKYLDDMEIFIKGENTYKKLKLYYDVLGKDVIGKKKSYLEDIFKSIGEMYSFSVKVLEKDLYKTTNSKNYLYYYTYNPDNNLYTHGFLNYSNIKDINYYFTIALDLYYEDSVIKDNLFKFIDNLQIKGKEMFDIEDENSLKELIIDK